MIVFMLTTILEKYIKRNNTSSDVLFLYVLLKFSDEPDIQEGYSNLFKGIVSIYRNPTHHALDYKCSREYALKTCAFIDDLLKEIANSSKIN